MKNIDLYINEKLHLNKGIEVIEGTNYVHPDDNDAEELCKSFKTDEVMYCKYENGRNNVGKVKLMLGDGHFYIKPNSAKRVTEALPDTPRVSYYLLEELFKAGLGDSYVINAYTTRTDTSSRINNLKRKYHHFYLGELGMIFKDKKEANSILREAKDKYYLSGSYKYKVISIEEASKMKSDVHGDHIEDIKFIPTIV